MGNGRHQRRGGEGKGGKSFGANKGTRKGDGRPAVKQQTQNRDRENLTKKRITGILAEWKGKFGWIKPDEPIKHPAASRHKGCLYVGQEDVEADIQALKTPVSFFAYFDGTGLGAAQVRPTGGRGPAVQKHIEKSDRKGG